MRITIGTLVFACAACFPLARDEFVPVTVPVCQQGSESIAIATAPPSPTFVGPTATSSSDPCDAPPPSIALCSGVAHVRVGEITTEPNCYLDTKVRAGEVGRVMQCPSGVVVVFENATFVGDVADGYVNACKSTTYDFPQARNGGDDCTWRTEQRIEGSLSGALAFSYVEGPVAGRSCTLAWRARSTLEVIR